MLIIIIEFQILFLRKGSYLYEIRYRYMHSVQTHSVQTIDFYKYKNEVGVTI